jgi:hypothetical protein
MSDVEYLTVEHLSTKDLIRIFSKIEVNRDVSWNGTPCWQWTGSQGAKGHGRVGWQHKVEAVYRVLYAWAVTPIPRLRQGGEMDHLCRNPPCCNPAHLEFVPSRLNVHRGFNPAGINSRKTHCIRGHLLSGSNLYLCVNSKGRRKD